MGDNGVVITTFGDFMSNVLTPIDMTKVESAIRDIRSSWKKTTDAILETAETLYNYKLSAEWGQIEEELDSRNIIKKSVQKFLVGIAQNPTLMNAKYRDNLPPHYNSLYHLSRIGSDKLETLINKGDITSATQLDESRQFHEKYSKKKSSGKVTKRATTKILIEIALTTNRGAKGIGDTALDVLQRKFPDSVITVKSIK